MVNSYDMKKLFHNRTFQFFLGSFLVFILFGIPTIIDNLREKSITDKREYLSVDNNFDEYGLSNVTKEYLYIHLSHSNRFYEYNDLIYERVEYDFNNLNFLQIKNSLDSLSQEIWDSKNNYNDLMSSGILLSQFESVLFTELIDNSSLLYQITSQLGYILNKSNEFRDDLGNLDFMFESIKESNKLSELTQEYRLKVMSLNIKLEKYYQTIN